MSRATRRRPSGVLVSGCLALFIAAAAAANAAPARAPGRAQDAHRATLRSGFDRLAEEAGRAKEAGRLPEAITLYQRALALKPSWLEGRWALGTLLYDTNRYEEALGHFERLVEARPSDGSALALKGLCEAMLKKDEQAAVSLLRARSLGIANPEVRPAALYRAALIVNKLGDPDGAFEILREFGQNSEDQPSVILAFGLITLRLPWVPEDIPQDKRELILLAGRVGFDMARARRTAIGRLAVEELVTRFPREPNVHFAFGLYLLPDDPAGAVDEFHRELVVSPDHHVAMIYVALAELKRGRAEQALPFAEKAASLAPNVPAAHLALGRALLALGQVERALQELESATHLAPENPRLHFALAQAYERAGREQDAARERGEFQRLRGTQDESAGTADEGVPSGRAGGNQ